MTAATTGWRTAPGLTDGQRASLHRLSDAGVTDDELDAMAGRIRADSATVTVLPSSPLDASIGRHPAGSKLLAGDGLPAVLAGIDRDALTAADRLALAALLTCRSCDGPLRAAESVEAGLCGLCRVAGGAA